MADIEQSLKKIASNLWFEWNADVHSLFRHVSPYVWRLYRRNLHRFLTLHDEHSLAFRYRLTQLLADTDFLALFENVWNHFDRYIHEQETVVAKDYPALRDKTVAYFSMEYGFDILPIYSGGLGVLSGDHLRGASDIGLKMAAAGLFYIQGYYSQQIGLDGNMKAFYQSVVPPGKAVKDYLPLKTVKRRGTQEELILDVQIKDRVVKARVWKVQVGRVELLLLDTNLRENSLHDRHISRRLYASQKHHHEERRRRLEQEILLGIGGIQALHEAGYEPAVYHLNEGHVAFAAIEIIRRLMAQEHLSFEQARNRAALKIGFTTHTPVPEGNERFDEKLARGHLQGYLDSFLKPEEREFIFNCARNQENLFDMTKLSLLLSGVFRNGVSRLHGEVCRRMWGYAWGISASDSKHVPIGSVTNSVHLPYWQKPKLRHLIEKYGGIDRISEIPDQELWNMHLLFKTKLIAKARQRFAYQLIREDVKNEEIHQRAHELLSQDAFFIGFARRFAQYKRVTLFLDDEELLFNFLERVYRKYRRPVHILYGGKPHPDNYPGRASIRHIYEAARRLDARARERRFKAQIIFVQGYDINLARYLEAGVDIWLNNPIRPLEASGTSGMKAGLNGVLNVSISDGWVPEGIVNGVNGWTFGEGSTESAVEDRKELFRLLEETILPIYYERPSAKSDFSPRWVRMMKESIQSMAQKFNTERMMREYIEKMYLPAVEPKNVGADLKPAPTANA